MALRKWPATPHQKPLTLKTHPDGLVSIMVTVLVEHGFRFVIFINDHEPAHVHVFADGHAKICLVGEGAPSLISAKDMTRADLRRALSVCREHREGLLAKWRAIHG